MGDATCVADGCEKPPRRSGRGYCGGHYMTALRGGDIPRLNQHADTCSIDDCVRPFYSRGWCRRHYDRWLHHGDPLGGLWPNDRDSFFANVDKSTSGCWRWTASLNDQGYGYFSFRGRRHLAHRLAYEWERGGIPLNHGLDHMCHNRDTSCAGGSDCRHRACVNPAHLEPASQIANTRRGCIGRKTHCVNGHPFDSQNTITTPSGHRACRACRQASNRATYAERPKCKRGHPRTAKNTRIAPNSGRKMCKICLGHQATST